MSDPTNAQRAMMAADLAERATITFRRADYVTGEMVLSSAAEIASSRHSAWIDYELTLQAMGIAAADIDAAVAAIARGEHPPDSLPGQLMRYHGKAKREAESVPGSFREHHCEGEVKGLGCVLSLLGCKVKP